jgi:hypothetical protein
MQDRCREHFVPYTTTKTALMSFPRYAALLLLPVIFLGMHCAPDNNKKGEGSGTTAEAVLKQAPIPAGNIPVIDSAALDNEADILYAMQMIVDARLADDKKKNEDPAFEGHYLELSRIYTMVLNAATHYSKSLGDPASSLEFDKKVSTIQDKMDRN